MVPAIGCRPTIGLSIVILHYQPLLLDQTTVLEKVTFKPPLKSTQRMDAEACLIYSVNGHSTVYGGTQRDTLEPGEAVLMKCGTFINHWRPTEAVETYEAVVIHFNPALIRTVYEDKVPDFLLRPAQQSQFFQKLEAEEVMEHYIQGLQFYFDNPSLCTNELVKLKVKELIHLLCNTGHEPIRQLLADLFQPQVIAFREVIQRNLFQELTVEDFAQLTNLSLSSFKRRFKEIFQETPARYIKHKRLEKAAELLKRPHVRVSDVCYECGFNDLSNFSKSFTRHFSCSPSEYQKQFLA